VRVEARGMTQCLPSTCEPQHQKGKKKVLSEMSGICLTNIKHLTHARHCKHSLNVTTTVDRESLKMNSFIYLFFFLGGGTRV
jgi:hypothetical protein